MLLLMNISEKITMLHGHLGVYVGNIIGNDRLGIPSLNMQDGPQGFRTTDRTGPDGSSTAWPSALTAATSWDIDVMYRWASAMAQEFKQKGANVQLAPGIGLARVPTAGRNFEYLSGEDPYLGAILVGPVIKGIQDQGVIANAKHWVNNEIEDKRNLVSANVGERTRWEFYYPPFAAALRAGVLSVMCSYNRVNDVHACENTETLGDLKDSMAFGGWVMSDWLATHSTADSLNAGLDQEMPFGAHFSEYMLQKALSAGEIQEEQIDQSVRRILTAMYSIGLFDREPSGDPNAIVTSPEHCHLAREIAGKATVLLKNSGLLPLDPSKWSKKVIAVIGDENTVYGGGSGHVSAAYTVSPAQGITNALQDLGFSDIEVKYLDGSDIAAAAALAASADVAVVTVATTSSEGKDRDNLSLGGNQDELVVAVLAANPFTVVSVNTPGASLLPWSDEVPAVLVSMLGGQESGNALADVIFGRLNPSARLPVTLPNKENEVGFSQAQYPGVGFPPEASYTEELHVGYRYYEAQGVIPLFCFGHGLSYTAFAYSDLQVEGLEISVRVKNVGAVAGAEVVQLYVSFPAHAQQPPKQLRAFSKVTLLPGAEQDVVLSLSAQDLSVWSLQSHAFELVRGKFAAHVGASSCDVRLTAPFTV